MDFPIKNMSIGHLGRGERYNIYVNSLVLMIMINCVYTWMYINYCGVFFQVSHRTRTGKSCNVV